MKCLYWSSGEHRGRIIDIRQNVYTENELANIAGGIWATVDCPSHCVDDARSGRMYVSEGVLAMLPVGEWPESMTLESV